MSQNNASSTVWRLRRGMDRRFRSGHPWVYSNELEGSPKGVAPGASVELRDASGKFLARGFGNPNSLIAFRTLSRDSEEKDPFSVESVSKTLQSAHELRVRLGLADVSHRLCFGEADGLPGLVIDRYKTRSGQVFAIQAHSAGADRLLPQVMESLEKMAKGSSLWDQTSVVLRNDLSVRKLEGLAEEEAKVLKSASRVDLKASEIFVRAALGVDPLVFKADLLSGQKTGFFLDQSANIQLAALRFQHLFAKSRTPIRILDLCCYVGQWGSQLAKVFKDQGLKTRVVAVDASAQALEFARHNVEAQGADCETLKADVLKDLGSIEAQSFDLVISDPPALIKSRKDIPAGTHAYLQLATQAIRWVKKGGGLVCCSCSALLEEESFTQGLAKATLRNSAQIRWVGRGAQSPDHPVLAEFPEGRYLKGWVGLLS